MCALCVGSSVVSFCPFLCLNCAHVCEIEEPCSVVGQIGAGTERREVVRGVEGWEQLWVP